MTIILIIYYVIVKDLYLLPVRRLATLNKALGLLLLICPRKNHDSPSTDGRQKYTEKIYIRYYTRLTH